MRKYLLTLILFTLAWGAIAQQKSTIHLIQSTKGVKVSINGVDVFKVYNGVFQQKYSTLRSDSAYVYLQNNTFDAFGHVVINQGDSLNIYSNKLNYNDNTKIAILTDNVRMVDKDATLTTNYLTYNTATRYGTYTGGGKLVNKDNTLVSKNGYYYAFSRDAYFRYDVVLTTPDALIKTDTLRYNSGSRIAYFYGPTNIYGKKDKDTLYTENGTYNTKTEQAFFGKKNQYKQGTKSLKGDSLFYDRLKGYGKAVKHVTFNDNEQKITIKGNLGEYYKKGDRAVITQNPYVIFVTEQKKDSTKTATDSLDKTPAAVNPSDKNTVKNTVPLKPDALTKLKNNQAGNQQAVKAKADSLAKTIAAMPQVKNTVALTPAPDTLKKLVTQKTTLATKKDAKNAKPASANKNAAATNKKVIADSIVVKPVPAPADTGTVKRDSMYIGADTLETQVITYKELKDIQKARFLAGLVDTSKVPRKPFVPYKTIPKFLELDMPKLILEKPSYIDRPLFTVEKAKADTTLKSKKADSLKTGSPAALTKTADKGKAPEKLTPVDKKAGAPPLPVDKNGKVIADAKIKTKADSLKSNKPALSDTSRIRVLSAHHNVHIFKSDLQGKSDSLFYSSSDSIIRSFIKPMYWTQGSQISGDTIFMQLKNKKLDNMDIFPSAFIVNIEDKDSTHFNQAGGKRMKGYFKDNKLALMNIEGNAETIYFNHEKGKVTQMQRSLSSGILVHLKNNQMTKISFLIKPDNKYYPINKVKEDDKILKGFIWKPKERPLSKEDVINPKKIIPDKPAKKDTTKKAPPGKTPLGKAPAKNPVVNKTKTSVGKTTTGKAPVVIQPTKPAATDSVKVQGVTMSRAQRDSLGHRDSIKIAPDVMPRPDTAKGKKTQ